MKTKIRDVRRGDLQKAAFDLLAESGFHGATLANIAARLGVSRGLVHHYFQSRDELLEAAVRYGNRMISEQLVAMVRHCRTPRQRLNAIIDANFGNEIYITARAQYWVSYCAEATVSERFGRLLKIQNSRMRSNLLHELRQLLSPRKAEHLAEVLSIFMDGIWVRKAVDGGFPERAEALRMVKQMLDMHLNLAASGKKKHLNAIP
jgi:TetR/AcrR family transcriptional regulator, transcriptional repressor of bet genes